MDRMLLTIRSMILLLSLMLMMGSDTLSQFRAFCTEQYSSGGTIGNCVVSYSQFYCDDGSPAYCDCNSTYCETSSGFSLFQECSCYI